MIRDLVAAVLVKAAGVGRQVQFQPEWLRAPVFELTFANIVREGYRKNSAVYACIRTHATSFPEPPMVVKVPTRRGRDVVENHPLAALLERPNPFMGQAEFWAMTITWMGVGGNAYIWKRRDNLNRPIELWPLHDGLVRARFHPTEWIAGYELDAGDGRKVPIPAEDIIHLRWAPDPLQPQVGMTPIMAVAREVDTDNEAARYIHALLKNDAVPRTLVTVRNGLTDSAFKRLKRQFQEQYGGSKRGDVMVLEGQDMTIDRLGLNLNELADAALRRVPETRISGSFEVPAILAGLGSGLDSATYSNAKELREFFTETTLIPRWRAVAAQFQAQLLPEFGDPGQLVVEFDLSQVRALADDEDAKWNRWRGAWADGVATLNEARVALGMEPTRFGDVFLRGGSVVPADENPAEAREAARLALQGRRPDGSPAGTDRADDDDGARDDGSPRALPAAPRPAAPSRNGVEDFEAKADAEDDGDKLERRRERAFGRLIPLLEAAVGEALDELAEKVADRVDDGDEPLADGDHDALRTILGDAHLAAANQAALDVKAVLGGAVTPLTAAELELDALLEGLAATTAEEVATAISSARENPGGAKAADGLGDRVLARLRFLWEGRAKTIATTEAVAAYNRGFLDAYVEAGHGELVQVSDGDDDKPCREANGKLWTVEYARAHPAQHPNCRRRFGPPRRKGGLSPSVERELARAAAELDRPDGRAA